MTIDRSDFDALNEADIAELLVGQVPEGLRIDYKRDLHGNSDGDKREALKDISAFANAAGGHLIIGVEERDGLPVAIPGVTGVNVDDTVLRLDQLARSGIEPRIQGLRVKAVALANGASCFVVRIPRSWHPPHRVSAQNSNRYWIRNSGGCHEASVEELRSLFTQGSDAIQRVYQFRDERLSEITGGRGSRPLQGSGRLIVHIIPLSSVISRIAVDLRKVHQMNEAFRPIGSTGMTPRFNVNGFVNDRGGDQNHGYTQVFRNGAVEATKAGIVREYRGRKIIAGRPLESQIFEVLPGYMDGLREIGVPAPLVTLLTLEGVMGVAYAVADDPWPDPEPPLDEQIVYLPECYIEDYGSVHDYQRALRPAIDALWNASGYSEAQTYNAAGEWVGRRNR